MRRSGQTTFCQLVTAREADADVISEGAEGVERGQGRVRGPLSVFSIQHQVTTAPCVPLVVNGTDSCRLLLDIDVGVAACPDCWLGNTTLKDCYLHSPGETQG